MELKEKVYFRAMSRGWAAENLVMSDRYWRTREEGVRGVAQVSGLSGHGAHHRERAW